MRWPSSKKDLFEELGWDTKIEPGEKKLATQIKISEVWFKWYKPTTTRGEDGSESETRWEHINGVAWKYKKVLFDKKKNPNWDWEGDEHTFIVDGEDKKEVTPDVIREGIMTGNMPDIQSEKVYRNHLEEPEFPFIFIGYDQLGTQPYDVTTRIEQIQTLQDNVNSRGMQITSMAATAWGVDVFSTESGLKKPDIQKIDKTDPKMSLLLYEDISKVYTRIPGVQPSSDLFKDMEGSRERVFAKMGAHATTRGEREAQETARGRQMLQDADYNKQDDETEETINYAAEKLANAALQYIKLRYTEDKLVRLKGPDGKTVFERLRGDMVEDGMEVTVSASAVDKRRRRNEALQRAEMQMTDPLSFFEDMGTSNAKERTERLMWFTVDPKSYLSKYVMGVDPDNPQEMGQALNGGGDGGQQQLATDIAMLTQGQMPQIPEPLTPEYIQGITQFLQTPDYQALPENITALIQQYAQQVSQAAGGAQ